MGVITVTELESVRRCGWQWDFGSKNRMGLESSNPLHSLYTGTLWHKAMDTLAQQEQLNKLPKHAFDLDAKSKDKLCKICHFSVEAHSRDPFLAVAGMLTLKVRSHYEEVTGRQISQVEMKPTFDTIQLVQTMLQNYKEYYRGRLIPEGYEYIQTEQQFFKELPGTEHCECYSKPKCGCSEKCRYKFAYYQHCKCEGTECECRQFHKAEGTLDGLMKHTETEHVAILENKTFSVHPDMTELRRTPQFIGYTWIGAEFDIDHLLYNGIWAIDHLRDGYNRAAGRKWTKDDMFIQKGLRWKDYEINTWVEQAATTAMQVFDPRYKPVRVVHPVGGCNGVNGCSYKTLCDARFYGVDYERILKNEYRQRE